MCTSGKHQRSQVSNSVLPEMDAYDESQLPKQKCLLLSKTPQVAKVSSFWLGNLWIWSFGHLTSATVTSVLMTQGRKAQTLVTSIRSWDAEDGVCYTQYTCQVTRTGPPSFFSTFQNTQTAEVYTESPIRAPQSHIDTSFETPTSDTSPKRILLSASQDQ